MRKITFYPDGHYHVYNRGVDKRIIFLDKRDYERFLYILYACNDTAPLENSQFYYRGFASIEKEIDKRDRLVDIVCFCLMPNHYHLLLRERQEGGISKFMQKLGTGYTMYFNTKYARNGVLFQGVFKAIEVKKEGYLEHLTRYIHLNPAELQEPKWKERGIRNWDKTHAFIKQFPWSSYTDYLGKKRFHKILNQGFVAQLYTPSQYENFVKEWVVGNLGLLAGYTLEQ